MPGVAPAADVTVKLVVVDAPAAIVSDAATLPVQPVGTVLPSVNVELPQLALSWFVIVAV